MKQTIFTLLLITAIGFISCRKEKVEPGIKEYDQSQILSYISANGITGMKRDTVGGDTSGIYYKIILPGNGKSYNYTDSISLVYTIHTFDGLYNSLDTTYNHLQDYVGHIASSALPAGLQLVIHNVLKKGGSMRVLIPSRLAYGLTGYRSGSSSSNLNSSIAGNQCIDYYVHGIADQGAYDDQVLSNFLKTNNLTGYQKTASGLYYKILTPGAGTTFITDNSTVFINYTGTILNGTIFDQYNATATGTSFDIPGLVAGVQEGLKDHTSVGTSISLIMPSRLAYGTGSITGIPANSCISFATTVVSSTP